MDQFDFQLNGNLIADCNPSGFHYWIVENAESLLQLRCLEVNGDWEAFFAWTMRDNEQKLGRHDKVKIRAQAPKRSAVAA